jgi:hypothetical protein
VLIGVGWATSMTDAPERAPQWHLRARTMPTCAQKATTCRLGFPESLLPAGRSGNITSGTIRTRIAFGLDGNVNVHDTPRLGAIHVE